MLKSQSIKMHQNLPVEDATWRQVQALHPESSECSDNTKVHKLNQHPQQLGRHSFRGRGAFRGGRYNPRGGAHPWGQDHKHSPEAGGCEYCGSHPHKQRNDSRASGVECYICGRLGHFAKMCRMNPDNQKSDKTQVKHMDTEKEPHYIQKQRHRSHQATMGSTV